MLKFAWIQFLATWIVIWWFYSYLEALIFGARLVDTRVVSDLQGPRAKQAH
jgi:transmembrane protein 231